MHRIRVYACERHGHASKQGATVLCYRTMQPRKHICGTGPCINGVRIHVYVTVSCIASDTSYKSNIRSLCTNHRMATSQRDEGVSWSINNEPGGLRSNLQGNTSSLWIVMIFQLACKHAHTWATSAYIEHKLSLIPFFKLILYYKFIYLCASICWFMVIHSCD